MQENTLWQAVLGEIELSVSRGNFVTWFKNTQLIRQNDDVIVIGVPNIFVKNQLERKFNTLVMEILNKNSAAPQRVEYKIHTGIAPAARRKKRGDTPRRPPSPPTTAGADLAPTNKAFTSRVRML